jgi:6-phosphogluconate dehydrogenase
MNNLRQTKKPARRQVNEKGRYWFDRARQLWARTWFLEHDRPRLYCCRISTAPVSKKSTNSCKPAGITQICSASQTLEEFVLSCEKPRRVMLMVKPHFPEDEFIESTCCRRLESGDNHHRPRAAIPIMKITIRARQPSNPKGMYYIGAGRLRRRGGGARLRATIMPGGSPVACPRQNPFFQSIAAKVGGAACSLLR